MPAKINFKKFSKNFPLHVENILLTKTHKLYLENFCAVNFIDHTHKVYNEAIPNEMIINYNYFN